MKKLLLSLCLISAYAGYTRTMGQGETEKERQERLEHEKYKTQKIMLILDTYFNKYDTAADENSRIKISKKYAQLLAYMITPR